MPAVRAVLYAEYGYDVPLDEYPTTTDWRTLQPQEIDAVCPHCERAQYVPVNYAFVTRSPQSTRMSLASETEGGSTVDQLQYFRCLLCRGAVVYLQRLGRARIDDPDTGVIGGQVRVLDSSLIWPRSAVVPASVRQLPEGLRADAEEVFLVAPISPRASAALGRRFIERYLVEHLGANPSKGLVEQIVEVEEAHRVSPNLIAQLDAVRLLGNVGVHPKADKDGVALEVEPHEVELLCHVIEGLADLHVGEMRRTEQIASIQAKVKKTP